MRATLYEIVKVRNLLEQVLDIDHAVVAAVNADGLPARAVLECRADAATPEVGATGAVSLRRCAASHSKLTPSIPLPEAAVTTRPQCSGAMLSRSRILRAASYPQPIASANSPMVFQLETSSEMVDGLLIAHIRTLRTTSIQAHFVHLGR